MSDADFDPEAVGLISDVVKKQDLVRRRKKIPQVGQLSKRRKLLRNSQNLRFKEVYKPIDAKVGAGFLFVAGSIYLFLYYHVW
ncbi:hypothetical protein TrVE_jg12161 [Triparma verrucosa]|uniref:Uncharacterized protein n=2 Tax=Triparma TaxID=722752 RepID=A0A9W7APU3_9STRA|nr:hypothetical protein TrST_g9590 [Triparma strigata]GMH93727.1 hypothetical protein TrVE_jg12161 [Triparma verrucosa]|mmetsp:Transcript_8252/g.15031  ORF Transcript_8252/g.15031 Transcript_8252/m.15031 type:complete len:83 (-) Transcript_8252:1022-1270(-)